MRAILVLFMTNAIATGGLGMTDGTATAIYGLYTAAVYLVALPGGWIADRLLGQRRAVFIGGVIIAAGHFTMAVPSITTFYGGLILIVMGTGLLKPNVSAMVGDLYPEGGARRDAGFSIYYMGINVGAFLGPLICGYLGENINWHLGFSAAGIGMVLGLIQYSLGGKHLKERRTPQGRGALGTGSRQRDPQSRNWCGHRDWRGPVARRAAICRRHRDHACLGSWIPPDTSLSAWRHCLSPTSCSSAV